MSHVRRQIREAVASRVTGLTTTTTHVFQSRVYAVAATELPCLLVYTIPTGNDEEIAKPVFCHPGELARICPVVIEGLAQANADLDDTLDQIAAEVETVMGSGDFTFGGLVKECQFVRTGAQIQGGDSPKPVGRISLVWQMRYATREGAPETAL